MSKAPRRARKKKVQPIPKLWEMSDAVVQAVIDHIKPKYPDSPQLARFEKEMKRREEGKSVEEVYEQYVS